MTQDIYDSDKIDEALTKSRINKRKIAAWDALVGFSDSELRADAQSLELEFVRLRAELENDDGKRK